MAKTINPKPQMDLNSKGQETQPSKLDLFTGTHTTSIIVMLLFLATLTSFIYLLCNKPTISENITSGFIGLLGVLAGFFAGTTMNKK